jgi:acetyl esterase/lipase
MDNPLEVIQQTYTFKVAEGCPIRADVYHAAGAQQAPAILWLHAGALIIGSRTWLSREQIELFVQAGFVVVAADYRLAPETKLSDIIADVQSAYAWLRSGVEGVPVDPDRIIVMGQSAGGYLTLLAGHWLTPRPKALVSFYGYGDVAGAWYSQPDDYYCQQALVTESEANQGIGHGVLSESPFEPRISYYYYCRQNGLWPKAVTGRDPLQESAALDSYCPVRQVTRDYPPVMLAHGDLDTDVPVQQSINMAEACQRQGVETVLRILPGLGHAFDYEEPGLRDPAIAKLFEEVLVFMRRHANLE